MLWKFKLPIYSKILIFENGHFENVPRKCAKILKLKQHFDCNFGSQYLPLDWAFGTFASCQEDVKKIWKRPDIGRDGNEGVVHASSLSKLAVS